MPTAASPLEGLLVIALEHAVAAPYCTSRLADAGARVIKVERPEGDFARFYDEAAHGESSYFVWLNRGKESLALDLRREDARATLAELLAAADVVVQNLKPGALAKLGFAVEDLRARHPRLICCSISGYGDAGPMATRKAYDLLIQAESGLCSLTGGPEEPSRVGISVVDIATGSVAHAAILEALIGRAASGRGADIRISMFDVMADWLTVPFLHQQAGAPPRRVGLAHPSIAPYGVFATKDGAQILIAIQNDPEWASLCVHLLDDANLARDERFATNVARVRNRAETDGRVAAALAGLDRAAAAGALARGDIAFADLNDMAALARHPHLRRVTVETAAGPVSYPAPAAIIDGAPKTPGPVPALGANHLDARPPTAREAAQAPRVADRRSGP